MKMAELYLVCMTCKRIPPWTKVKIEKDENNNTVKKYEFEGQCPNCGHGQFEVVEVTNKKEGSSQCEQQSASSATAVEGSEQKI